MTDIIIFVFGVCFGIVFMCLFQINRKESAAEYRLPEEDQKKQEGGLDEQAK